jgi:hypothetical protein
MLVSAMAYNHNSVLESDRVGPDSDGDGLSDSTELDAGIDPTLGDTDGDGYSDRFEYRQEGFSALRPDGGCEVPSDDVDGDGMLDCEELALGLDPMSPDSDVDGVLDGLEPELASRSEVDFGSLDSDTDGIPDHTEIRFHLEPGYRTPRDVAEEWGYRYLMDFSQATGDGVPCYSLVIDNISMSDTMATGTYLSGQNVVDVVVQFIRGDEPPRYFRARVVRSAGFAGFGQGALTAPIRIAQEDFSEL